MSAGNEPIPIDLLAPAAREALGLDAGAAYAALTVSGAGHRRAFELLSGLSPENVLVRPPKTPAARNAAACVLAGLYLWHDCLDDAHRLSQDVHTPDGSFFHAIVHRREGDFWNSKYWFNKCRGHAILPTVARRCADLVNAAPADKSLLRLTLGDWDPHAFVDLVEALVDAPADPRRGVVVALQRTEWRSLFEHVLREAAKGH